MSLTIDELVKLRQILDECRSLAYKEDTINRLLESDRILIREIRLKTTNFVTGKPFDSSNLSSLEPLK